jgi:hypothetical protein
MEKRAKHELKLPVFMSSPLKEETRTPTKPQASAHAVKTPDQGASVLDFLKSRPQIAALQKTNSSSLRGTKRKLADVEASELVDNDRFEGEPSAWQQNETVVDFLRRAPIDKPSTAGLGKLGMVSVSRKHR